jgi:hypothetical protein
MPTETVWLIDADGNEREVDVHVPWVVCGRCDGEGRHGNPAFDGVPREWWIENDPSGKDFDAYLSGSWDVRCEECDGRRVVLGSPHFGSPSDEEDYWRAVELSDASNKDREAEQRAEQAFARRLGF